VQDLVNAYLGAVDSELPGLVEGLYLVGSVALDDFQPGVSDVDFVAVTATAPDAGGIAGLIRVHAQLRQQVPWPSFDGTYVTWQELAHDPRLAAPGPHAQGDRLTARGRSLRHPVTWHEIAQHGLALRGPARESVAIWTDRDRLRAWTLDNLDGYWRRWLERSARLFSKPGLTSLGSGSAEWGVLGVSRLHYTLATGEITSKRGAGLYAREAFPARWHQIVDECLRIRCDANGRSLYRSRRARRDDALAFMAMVIDDAHNLNGPPCPPGTP